MHVTQNASIKYTVDPNVKLTTEFVGPLDFVEPAAIPANLVAILVPQAIEITTPAPRELTPAEEEVLHTSLLRSVKLIAKGRLIRNR